MQRFILFHAQATMGIEIKADEVRRKGDEYEIVVAGQVVGQFDRNKVSGWVNLSNVVMPDARPFGFDDTDVTFH